MARLLDRIEGPLDLKRLKPEDLPRLCQEIREEIIGTCSRNGGHLGSSLGAVELVVALHYVYNSPLDRLVFDVAQAANGLRLISAMHVDRPDVILLDVMMSWIDGFELCRAIKQNPSFHDIPVIFISARKSNDDERAGRAAGAADYFSKPLDMERLVSRMHEILASRRSAEG